MGRPYYNLKFDAEPSESSGGAVKGILAWLGIDTAGVRQTVPVFEDLMHKTTAYLKAKGFVSTDDKVTIVVAQSEYDEAEGVTCIPEDVLYATIDFLYSGPDPILKVGKPPVNPILQPALDKLWERPKNFMWGSGETQEGQLFDFIAVDSMTDYNGVLSWTYYGYEDSDIIYCGRDTYEPPGPNLWFEVFTTLEPAWKSVNILKLGRNSKVYNMATKRPYCRLLVSGTQKLPFNQPGAVEEIAYYLAEDVNGKRMQAINTDFIYFQDIIQKYRVVIPYEPPNPTPLVFYPQKHEGRYPFSCIAVPFSGVHPLDIAGATPGQLVAIGQDGGFVAKDIPKGKKVLE